MTSTDDRCGPGAARTADASWRTPVPSPIPPPRSGPPACPPPPRPHTPAAPTYPPPHHQRTPAAQAQIPQQAIESRPLALAVQQRRHRLRWRTHAPAPRPSPPARSTPTPKAGRYTTVRSENLKFFDRTGGGSTSIAPGGAGHGAPRHADHPRPGRTANPGASATWLRRRREHSGRPRKRWRGPCRWP
jgi:hypothetical protein